MEIIFPYFCVDFQFVFSLISQVEEVKRFFFYFKPSRSKIKIISYYYSADHSSAISYNVAPFTALSSREKLHRRTKNMLYHYKKIS